jgi:RND family efflux transporter MFP subunit
MANDGDQRRGGSKRLILVTLATIVFAIVLAVGGILIRSHDESALAEQTDAAAVTPVDVINPSPIGQKQTLTLPGDIQAWFEAPVYAQVTGYLHMWYKDIGAVVKAGDLLGQIDTPALDEQLREATATLAQAQAQAKLAEITAARWKELLPTNAVARQTVDVNVLDAEARQAAVVGMQANVDRLKALEGFKQLVAPFDGVVTARRIEVGGLVKADSTPEPELFAVADISSMRVYVKVPQSYAGQVYIGMKAELALPEYPDRIYTARVITTSHAINVESRTMLVELLAPNPRAELSPGSFANVYFQLTPDRNALLLPTSALIFQQHGMQVAIVDAQNKVALRQIRIGHDTGTEVEVISGISKTDKVIDDPPDSIAEGQPVRVMAQHAAPPGGASVRQTPLPGQ